MKAITLVLFGFFFSIEALSQNGTRPDIVLLKELNARFIHNFVTGDTLQHTNIIHPHFVYITSSGEYINRKKYMADWLHGFKGHVYWDYRDERIEIIGTTALVHATNKYIIRDNEKDTTGMVLYTDVYVKENGVWKCVQAQITPVSTKHYPSDATIVRKYDFRK